MVRERSASIDEVNLEDYFWTDEVLDIHGITLAPDVPERSLSTKVLDALERFWRWLGLV